MDFMEDPKFVAITKHLSEPCGIDKIKDIIDSAENIWLNKCGHAFIRNATSVIYNRHFYEKGTSFTGGRINVGDIINEEIGRVFVNTAYVLKAIKLNGEFTYVNVNEKNLANPSFDIFIEY